MDKYPTPTLDLIRKMQADNAWKAKGFETLDPTSLDDKMRDVLLLGSLELIGLQIFEGNQIQKQILKELKKQGTPQTGTPAKVVKKAGGQK